MKDTSIKKAAKISLVVLLISIVFQLLSVYQIRYQLISPIIPGYVALKVEEPFIANAFVSTILCIIALGFYFYSKYVFTIVACGIALVWQQVYPYF